MLRPSNVICSVRPRKAIVGLFATFASIALLPCGVALADSVTTNFEPNAAPPFNLGSVNGQGMVNGMPGWKSAVAGQESCPPFSPYDQEVVQNSQFYSGGVTGFGQQSLRFSNLVACGEFTYQTYSTPVQDPAGENETNKVYTAQFSLIPTTPKFQDGLYVSVSPDDYTGARMFRVDLTDTPSGVLVGVAYATGPDGDFAFAPNLAVLDPSVPHTIKVSMKVNPGDTSDLVRVSIDGADTGQCFGSWKNYYLAVEKRQMPPDINSLQFRASRSGFTMTERRLPVRQRDSRYFQWRRSSRLRREDRQGGRLRPR